MVLVSVLALACGGTNDAGGEVALGGQADGATAADCAAITAFGERLTQVGIAYDYDPTASPLEVVEQVDVAVQGRVTGEVTEASRTTAGYTEHYVVYGVEVERVLAATSALVNLGPGDIADVAVAYSPGAERLERFQDAVVPGAEVVVFALLHPDPPPLYVAHIEGFLTACEGAEPVGWRGTLGDWARMATLDDVITLVAGEPAAGSAFDDPELAGLCESFDVSWAWGAPGHPDEEAAVAAFLADEPHLADLEVDGVTLRFRGEDVGALTVAEAPAGGWYVDGGSWCYPEG